MVEETAELVPLNEARHSLIPKCNGRSVNASTVWRWVHKGLPGSDGERIKLNVIYVGRTPHVSKADIRHFFESVTKAKFELFRRRELHAQHVSVDELQQAGLMSRAAKNN